MLGRNKHLILWGKSSKFKTKPYTTAKVVLTIFLNFEDQICCYYLETQRTTNGEYYRKKGGRKCGQQFWVSDRVCRVKKWFFSKTVLVPSKLVKHWKLLSGSTGIPYLTYPSYSPDFHLFGPIIKFLQGKRLENNDEVKIAVQVWIRRLSQEFFVEDTNLAVTFDGKRV